MAEETTGLFAWLQDNARILLSIILVLILLFFVYSYSQKRSQDSVVVSDNATQQEELSTDKDNADAKTDTTEGDAEQIADVSLKDTSDTIGADPAVKNASADASKDSASKEQASQTPSVAKTLDYQDNAIVVSAVAGEGMTHLARRATAAYLEKNGITDLSGAQKVYIEDFLRKSVPAQNIYPQTSISFSHELIAEGITQARALTDAQKKHLAQFAARAAL